MFLWIQEVEYKYFYKIEEPLNVVEGFPDVISVCETLLTNLRTFVSKLYGYDFLNKLSNSNQSGGDAFLVTVSYEVVEGVSLHSVM